MAGSCWVQRGLPAAAQAEPAASARPINITMTPVGPVPASRIVSDGSAMPDGAPAACGRRPQEPRAPADRSGLTAASLPTINTLIDVVLHDGDVYESRVEGVTGKRLSVAAPHGVAMVDVPRAGALLEIAW